MSANGPRRTFLHVGAPKSGTTFVQTALWDHRDILREHGVLFPGTRYDDHFFAAVDLQQLAFHGQPRPEAAGRWEQVAAAARSWPGTSVISHDVFASASAEQVEQALADLAPAEVHVVYTARDLARQVPSHWQEAVKHGSTERFDEWYAAVSRRDGSGFSSRWFWQTQEVPAVLARWSATLPPERVHLVTVPPEGVPRDTLWRRFCSVVGIDPGLVDLDAVQHTNTALGAAEVELLRRVNGSLDGALPQVVYEHVVKGVFAHDTLARRAGRRFAAPPQTYNASAATAREWVDELRRSGVDVVGELRDLLPAGPPHDEPVEPSEAEVAAAAVWASGQVLLRLEDERVAHRGEVHGLHEGLSRAQGEVCGLHEDLARTQAELDELHRRMRRIDQHPLVRFRFRLRRLLGRLRGR